jgi:elongation factor G
VLAGFPLTDLRVSVIGGKYHEVDSHKMNFEIAGSMALKQACKKAGLVLLEPIMQVETRVTEEQVGSVVNDFSGRRGRIEGIGQRGQGLYTIQAVVPLRNMFGYVTALRSMSSGRGIFSMEFERYAPVEQAVADEIAGEKRKPLPGSSSRTRDPGLLRK